jgi:hypothetical protein
MDGKHIKGYIQQMEVGSSVEIGTYYQLQFDCLHATDYMARILHTDGTGQKVKIRQHTNDVHKFAILN